MALEVEGLTRRRNARDPNAIELIDVSLKAHHGEILGLAGLVGAGRTETGSRHLRRGSFRPRRDPCRRQGGALPQPRATPCRTAIGLVPGGPQEAGVVPRPRYPTNLTIAAQDEVSRGKIFIDERTSDVLIDEFRKALMIRMASQEQMVANLSGGNQQKVVLARWLALQAQSVSSSTSRRAASISAPRSRCTIFSSTWRSRASRLSSISSELPEVLAISDRIVTMREGRVTGEIAATKATQENG